MIHKQCRLQDWIADLGLGAGVHGEKIAYQGTYKNILKDKSSITGNYLSKNKRYFDKQKKQQGETINLLP